MAGTENKRKVSDGNMLRKAYWFELSGGLLSGNSKWEEEKQAFKCGHCKRLMTYEMIVFDSRNPRMLPDMSMAYGCPNCGYAIVIGPTSHPSWKL